MTTPVSGPSVVPVHFQGRDTGHGIASAAPGLVRAERVQSQHAPLPVDPADRSADMRFLTSRDQPVGPSPAFVITLLQHLRETAFDPPEAPADTAVATVAKKGASATNGEAATAMGRAYADDGGTAIVSATAQRQTPYAADAGSVWGENAARVDWRF